MAWKKTAPKKYEYFVYVIELDKAVLKYKKIKQSNPDRNEKLACLYVGQSVHPPQYRFEQHLNGYKANRYVKKHGHKLREDLFEDYNPIRSRKLSEYFEEELALKLRAQGYTVWYGV